MKQTLAEKLVIRWSSIINKAISIPTWTEPHNLAYLCEQATKASHAVELGTYMGASAFCMLRANPNLHLWCVDTFQVFGTEQITRMFLGEYIAAHRCELIKGNSLKAAGMLEHMKGKIDLVFVDDGHAEEDVVRDITSFQPLLRSGGIMCGHDFDVPHNDVARGVIQTGIKFTIPVPRMWEHVKP